MDIIEILFAIVATTAFYLFIRLIYRKRIKLQNKGVPANAKILKITKTNIEYGIGSRAVPLWEIDLEIYELASSSRKLTIKQAIDENHIPKTGDQVPVLVDPDNPKSVMISLKKY
jgi:hypothetical protein